jgi:hypothetical protein
VCIINQAEKRSVVRNQIEPRSNPVLTCAFITQTPVIHVGLIASPYTCAPVTFLSAFENRVEVAWWAGSGSAPVGASPRADYWRVLVANRLEGMPEVEVCNLSAKDDAGDV